MRNNNRSEYKLKMGEHSRSLNTESILLFAFCIAISVGIISCNSGTHLLSAQAIQQQGLYAAIKKSIDAKKSNRTTITIPKGVYQFREADAVVKELYISNHDQDNPKKIGLYFENLKNVTIDGNGSQLVFHGRMLPIVLVNCENVALKNFSVDFEIPHIRQLNILSVDSAKQQLVASLWPKGDYRVDRGKLVVTGEGYEFVPLTFMAFREDKRLTYLRRDLSFQPKEVKELGKDTLLISGLPDAKDATPGERYALRSYYRPTPGIFIDFCKNTTLNNVMVHYAEGMGLLAQLSENITLSHFSVALKPNDPRYFTTQADATHFSGCKGLIRSEYGVYEGMADDAINVHGTYLKVIKRVDDFTLQARYMHPQSWGFLWGQPGDSTHFIESERMQLVQDAINTIKSIRPIDKPTNFGAKIFEISFSQKLPNEVSEQGKFGIENLSWTPEVIFKHNTVRNNRARGALFSTPKKVVCENNVFDHTHGTAILLCGDCNGWYETGACRGVTIRNNTFINALTATYQFTNAVISIYPEIPNLKEQQTFFHSGILIENNKFETFDRPLLYAKSTDGIVFKNNKVRYNSEFKPFHWNTHLFFFEKVNHVRIEKNSFARGFDPSEDMLIRYSDKDAVQVIE